jgi:ABC-type transport system substrate-binding protein
MMLIVRSVRSAAFIAALSLVIAACEASVPEPSATPSALGAATATPTLGPSPSPKMPLGGTLRVAVAAPFGPLDPRAVNADPLVVGQIFEGLVARAANGVAPALATKWLVGADGRTWTFTLRDGVVFHDGSPLDAAAVVTALGRPADPVIEKAEAPDPRTVVLTTRAPFGPFLSVLAGSPYSVASPSAKLAGTGPFRVPAGAEAARPLVLERNDRYWRSDGAGQRLPYLDRVSFSSIPDPGTRLASLRSGSVDLVTDLALGDIGAVRADPNLQVVTRPETTVLYLGLNLSDPAVEDLRVRQAIAQGINTRSLVDRLYAGAARPASQLPPPAMLGYDDSVTEFAKNDAAAARKLLTDSGNQSLPLDIWYQLGGPATLPEMRRVAEALAGDLGAAGVSVGTKTIDPITFDVSVRENRYPAWLGVAAAASFDPDELYAPFIPPVVNGVDQPTEGGSWANKEVAGLLRKARVEPDQSKRAELYKQVSKIVQREIPRIPLVWSAPLAAATKKVVDPKGTFFADMAMGK